MAVAQDGGGAAYRRNRHVDGGYRQDVGRNREAGP